LSVLRARYRSNVGELYYNKSRLLFLGSQVCGGTTSMSSPATSFSLPSHRENSASQHSTAQHRSHTTHPTIAPPPTFAFYTPSFVQQHITEYTAPACYSFIHPIFLASHKQFPLLNCDPDLTKAQTRRLIPRSKPIVNLIESR
jgi:hypothetical protein